MRFETWLAERNQRDATKMPEKASSLELHKKAAGRRVHAMNHGRAGTIESDKRKGSRGGKSRNSIDVSSRGE